MLILEFAATVERMSTSATSAGVFLASFVCKMASFIRCNVNVVSFKLHSTLVLWVREKIHDSFAIRANIRKKLVSRNTILLSKAFLNV